MVQLSIAAKSVREDAEPVECGCVTTNAASCKSLSTNSALPEKSMVTKSTENLEFAMIAFAGQSMKRLRCPSVAQSRSSVHNAHTEHAP